MNSFLKSAQQSIRSFGRDEEGAQVVEYALIIAVVSIVLVVALRGLNAASFAGFIGRVTACLNGTTATSCV